MITEAPITRVVKPVYRTKLGVMYQGDCADLLRRPPLTRRKGLVNLILTSPPFPLNRKKKYGNLTGDEYLTWLKGLAPLFRDYLAPDGSIVIELGNAWEPGQPTMSTLPMRALLAFQEAAKLHLCEEFICFNTARLPSPAQWVNVERIRVKDAFTRVWWLSPSPKPKADNRNVLKPYSESMNHLLKTGKYNAGQRPSEHHIGEKSFLINNGGAIPPNVLNVLPFSNTRADDPYQKYCRENGVAPHPARMPPTLADFFIRFLTDERDLVMDPFAGSNTTGSAAEKLARHWISIEKDATYAKTSQARVPVVPRSARLSPLSRQFEGSSVGSASRSAE